MTHGNRFLLLNDPLTGKPGLMIVDFSWWVDNERDILNWMAETLPDGIDHQRGMVLEFDSDYNRIAFLMKFGP